MCILKTNSNEYDVQCKTIGATPGTNIGQCQSSNEPCDVSVMLKVQKGRRHLRKKKYLL